MIYAAYGSNMNIVQMARRCPGARRLGTGIISGYELVFYNVATIRARRGWCVPIVLWEITEECEESLDIFEGFPHFYRKANLQVEFKNETISAMVYIMNEVHCQHESPPNEAYRKIIMDGYKQNNISKVLKG